MATQFESFFEELKSKYNLTIRESAPSEPELKASVQNFKELLKDLQSRGYVHMADLTAYDEAPFSPRFHVVYELISIENKKRCSVVVPVSDLEPKIATVTDIWKGADWLEREVYDMYGIVFEGHADMRRILLPPSFKGHPLRKDFIVDYRQDFEKKVVDEGMFDPFGTTVVRGQGANS